MPCSRMPKWRLRPAYSPRSTAPLGRRCTCSSTGPGRPSRRRFGTALGDRAASPARRPRAWRRPSFGRELRQRSAPIRRRACRRERRLELRRQLGVAPCAQASNFCAPRLRARARALRRASRNCCAHLVGDVERRLVGPAERFASSRVTSSAPSGSPCALGVSCLFGRAVADDACCSDDQRGPRRSRAAPASSAAVDRREVVAVVDVQRVPAVGLEALRHVLGERELGRPRRW